MAVSTMSPGLGWYLDRIKSTPLLTGEEEKQLSRRIRQHSDPIAREHLFGGGRTAEHVPRFNN